MGLGPTKEYICNRQKHTCKHLDAWYNGGMDVYGRCKRGVWKGIKSWPAGRECSTPSSCPHIDKPGA